jgi:hypothetical protein
VLHGATLKELIIAIPVCITNLPNVYKTDDAGLAAEMLVKYNLNILMVLDNKANMLPEDESPKRTQKIMVHGRELMKKIGKQ